MDSRGKLRLVTVLTLIRFPLVLVFALAATACALKPAAWLFCLAFASMVLSAATDLFDGYYARRFEVVTDFGAHADPLMDKLFYLFSLPVILFVATRNAYIDGGHAHPHAHAVALLALTVLFLARDQWVTFLRSMGAIYKISGAAHWSGKLRTCINFPLICAIYYYEAAPARIRFIPPVLLYVFEGVGLAANLISLIVYTRRYWPYLLAAMRVDGDKQGPHAD